MFDIDERLFLGTWNEDAVKAAFDPSTKPTDKAYIVYAASKTLGEQTAWKWVEKHNPQFIFNTVLPNFNVCINLFLFSVTSADTKVHLRQAISFTRKLAVRLWDGFEDFSRATKYCLIFTLLVSHLGLII